MNHYLTHCKIIDHPHSAVLEQAKSLSKDLRSDRAITKACFDFVRDEIKHSIDYLDQLADHAVTCSASEVLLRGHGLCYAKSHLLAALLRANQIPTALCYQRLVDDEAAGTFCLHGLNAVNLTGLGWLYLDARGNNARLQTDFNPPEQSLAYAATLPGEFTFSDYWNEPLPDVVKALSQGFNCTQMAENLPDRVAH